MQPYSVLELRLDGGLQGRWPHDSGNKKQVSLVFTYYLYTFAYYSLFFFASSTPPVVPRAHSSMLPRRFVRETLVFSGSVSLWLALVLVVLFVLGSCPSEITQNQTIQSKSL